jgi:hypothetical protein
MAAGEIHDSSPPFLWRDALTEKLIDLFRESGCLYDTKNPDYHNKDLKRMVLERIADEIGTSCKFLSYKATKPVVSKSRVFSALVFQLASYLV